MARIVNNDEETQFLCRRMIALRHTAMLLFGFLLACCTALEFAGVVDAVPKVDGREVVEARFFPVHSLPEPLSPRTRTRLALWQDWRSRASQR